MAQAGETAVVAGCMANALPGFDIKQFLDNAITNASRLVNELILLKSVNLNEYKFQSHLLVKTSATPL